MNEPVPTIPGPEVLLCDSSFLGHYEKAGAHPDRYRHWSTTDLNRVSGAILAITPFTLAEVRVGYQRAGWGRARIAAIENALSGYLLIPLDEQILSTYVDLKCRTMSTGRPMGFHDCWIAAAALSQGIPLVSSDNGHRDIPGLTTIYFPAAA